MGFPQGRYRHAIFAIACGCGGSFGVQPNGGNPFYAQDKGEEAVQLSMGDAIRSGILHRAPISIKGRQRKERSLRKGRDSPEAKSGRWPIVNQAKGKYPHKC